MNCVRLPPPHKMRPVRHAAWLWSTSMRHFLFTAMMGASRFRWDFVSSAMGYISGRIPSSELVLLQRCSTPGESHEPGEHRPDQDDGDDSEPRLDSLLG